MNTEITLDFHAFGLSDAVLAALARKGFTAPSSIQALALPRLLAEEGHLVAKARTGTGKTAAFGIPLVERLITPGKEPRALILTPTRELALQVSLEIRSLAGGPYPRVAAVYGGASMGGQLRDLSRGVEIVVGTPGRVMDHLERGSLDLSALEWLVLDEADEMLDMGFLEDVEAIMDKANPNRRVALFSATMPAPILRVVRQRLGDVDIIEDKATVDEKPAVDQFYLVLRREDKLEALRRIVDSSEDFHGLVFCATKVETDEVARRLVEGSYAAEALHGDLSQEARERTLRRFRNKLTTILVATDVAARGIDVERLTHVVNWDLPNDPESYVHRIGRTGRAGRRGTTIAFVLPTARGRVSMLSRAVERVLGAPIKKMDVPNVTLVMEAASRKVRSIVIAASGSCLTGSETACADTGLGESALDVAGSVTTSSADDGMLAASDPDNGTDPGRIEAARVFTDPSDPRAKLADELLSTLGPRAAVEALIAAAYGEALDPSRYKHIVEFDDQPRRDPRDFSRPAGRPYEGRPSRGFEHDRPAFRGGRSFEREGGRGYEREPVRGSFDRDADRGSREPIRGGETRVYIGVGRSHGASARDVAGLLIKAAGVPSRLVDSIDVREYCAFATLPSDAARKAFEYVKRDANLPSIRPAAPSGEKRGAVKNGYDRA